VAEIVLLDAGPLGMVSHPRPADDVVIWLARLLAANIQVLVPEIADYEVRRELLRARLNKSVRRLDELRATLGFLPITTQAMLRAAGFWAETRRKGRPTAHELTLDADAILAGKAATISDREVVVATVNTRHIERFVPAEHWKLIEP